MNIIMEPDTQVMSFETFLDKYGYLVYTNVGSSMLPLLRQRRDIIEIKKKGAERCQRYDAVLYKRGKKYVLHRVLTVREEDYVIAGDHCYLREYGISDEQILGVMTSFIRNGKRILVTDWRYRLYVHIWCDFYYVRACILYIRMLGGKVVQKMKKMRKTTKRANE